MSNQPMPERSEISEQSIIGDLLDRWEEAAERGQDIPAEQLCAETPHLIEQIRGKIAALRSMNANLLTHWGSEETQPLENAPKESIKAEPEYRNLTYLDGGALGVIYIGQDGNLHRDVAIKFIRPRLQQDDPSRERFLVEAEITGRLEHPGVVPLYARGQTPDGQPFYVMRYIKGESLDEALRRTHKDRALSRDEFMGVIFRDLLQHFVAICKTIAYAHNRGVLHRDIKPANVMLGVYGETLVVDWGLAIPIDRDAQARASGEHTLIPTSGSTAGDTSGGAAGTPAYMSPEQADGQLTLTPASDIYCLGATLYKILTGKPPVDGRTTREVMENVKSGRFPHPKTVNSAVPSPLEAICLKAMNLKPEDRYATALELARDVECWLGDEPITAMPDTMLRWGGRWFRRHRVAAQALTAAALALLILSGGAAIGFQRQAKTEHALLVAAEEAREQSVKMAARFAAKTLAGEMDLRWRILEAAAADGEIVSLLKLHDPEEPDPEITQKIQAWVHALNGDHNRATKSASWVLNDRSGVQVARSPTADTIGTNFAYRDYFHGQGKDLDPAESEGIAPVSQTYRTNVFESLANGHDMVAFSTPIWSDKPGTPDRKQLAVLMMTVMVGEFRILESGLQSNQIAALVDTRSYEMNGRLSAGRILQHPHLAEHESKGYHISADLIRELKSLRQTRLHPSSTNDAPGWSSNYQDPLAPDPNARWLAAFEPVLVSGRPDSLRDTGWVVIVQARGD